MSMCVVILINGQGYGSINNELSIDYIIIIWCNLDVFGVSKDRRACVQNWREVCLQSFDRNLRKAD